MTGGEWLRLLLASIVAGGAGGVAIVTDGLIVSPISYHYSLETAYTAAFILGAILMTPQAIILGLPIYLLARDAGRWGWAWFPLLLYPCAFAMIFIAFWAIGAVNGVGQPAALHSALSFAKSVCLPAGTAGGVAFWLIAIWPARLRNAEGPA